MTTYPDGKLQDGFRSSVNRQGKYVRIEQYELVLGTLPEDGDVYGVDGIPSRGSPDPSPPPSAEAGVLLDAGIIRVLSDNKAIVQLRWGTPVGDYNGWGQQIGTWESLPAGEDGGIGRESLRLPTQAVIDPSVTTDFVTEHQYMRPQRIMRYRGSVGLDSKTINLNADLLFMRVAEIRGVQHVLQSVRTRDRGNGATDVIADFWRDAWVPSVPAGTYADYPYELPELRPLDQYRIVFNSVDGRRRVIRQDWERTYGGVVTPSVWLSIGVGNLS